MDGRLEGRKELAQVLVTQAPSPSLLPWPGKAIANHKTTLVAYASDQTVQGSARSLPQRPGVPQSCLGVGGRVHRNQAGIGCVPLQTLHLEQPHFYLANTLGFTSH